MSSLVLTGFHIGLLVLLWLFIFMALHTMRKDTNAAAGVTRTSRKSRKRGALTPAAAPMAAPAPIAAGATLTRGTPRQITIVEGPLQGSHMDLGAMREIILGRSPESDFVLGDDFASARHARLFRRGSDWFVEDLDSRNGTFVSGMRIDQPERVGLGADVRVGRTTVRLIP